MYHLLYRTEISSEICAEISQNFNWNFMKFIPKFHKISREVSEGYLLFWNFLCIFFREKKSARENPFWHFCHFFTSRKTFSRTLFSVFFTPTYFFHGHSFVFLFFTGKKNGLTGRNFFFPRVDIFLVKRKFLSPKRQNSFLYPLWNWIQWYISQNEWSFFTHNFKLSRAHFAKIFHGHKF